MKFVFLSFILIGCGEVEFLTSSLSEVDNTRKDVSESDATADGDGNMEGKLIVRSPSNPDSNGKRLNVNDHSSSEEGTLTLSSNETLVDILLVVDNSSSMRRVNETLRTNFSSLIPDPNTHQQKLGANPWRIAITTSTASECLWSVMNKEDRNTIGHATEFQKVLTNLEYYHPDRTRDQRRNTNTEQTVQMATRALAGELAVWDNTANVGEECNGTANSWLREKSLLAVVLISDEDADDTTQPDDRCGGTGNLGCLTKLWNKMDEVRATRRTAEVYAMFHPRDNNVDMVGDPTGSTIYRRWHNRVSEGSFALYKPLYLWDGVMPRAGLFGLQLADIAGGLQAISARIKQQTQFSYYLPNDNSEDIDRVSLLLDGGKEKLLESDGFLVEDGVLTLTTSPPASTVGIKLHL